MSSWSHLQTNKSLLEHRLLNGEGGEEVRLVAEQSGLVLEETDGRDPGVTDSGCGVLRPHLVIPAFTQPGEPGL